MIITAALLLIPLMALAGRAHGHGKNPNEPGSWPSWARIASTVLFGLTFAGANYLQFGVWWLALAGGALTAIGFSAGHGRFYAMRGANLADSNPEWLERYFVLWWYPTAAVTKPFYSYFCMAIKGAMIGASAGWYGLSLVLLWPICYGLGFHIAGNSAPAEKMSGACAGALLFFIIFQYYI